MRILMLLATLANLFYHRAQGQTADKSEIPKSIYDFKVEGLSGDIIDFAQFKGKKILIVNTASKCGYTPQYEGLEALYRSHKDKLVIVGFPANNFLGQEPGDNEEIEAFCKKNYGVSFPMAAKISVKGKDKAPIYNWLTEKDHNGVKSSAVKWNFQKYLLDEHGKLMEVFAPGVEPGSQVILDALEK